MSQNVPFGAETYILPVGFYPTPKQNSTHFYKINKAIRIMENVQLSCGREL